MRVFIFISLFCLSIAAKAKENQFNTEFSKEDKQRIALLIYNNHFSNPRVTHQDITNTTELNRFLKKLDPYSKYLNTAQMRFKQKRNQNTRIGIGLDLLIDGEQLLGVPVKNGPAYKAGFKTPMYISRINKKQIEPSYFKSYQFLTEFSVGQRVEIETISKKSLKPHKYNVIVASFDQQHVFIQKFDEYSVLTIRQFSDKTTDDIKKIMRYLDSDKPLFIDLRHNPGGDLYATVDTLSFFLEKDVVVAYLEENNALIPLHSHSNGDIPKRKIYLLLSSFTASSAEVFAQAINHFLPQTTLIGTPSSGKCLAQEVRALPDQSALQLSAYQVLNAQKGFCQTTSSHIDFAIKGIETRPLIQIIEALP